MSEKVIVEWCGCAHDKEDHAAGHCAGEMIFGSQFEDMPPLTIPCACAGFKFWYSSEEEQ